MFPRSGNDPLALTSFSTTTPPPPSDTLPLVSFDDFGKLRLLPAQHFETSEKLKDECKDFKERTGEDFVLLLFFFFFQIHLSTVF
ncbi:hypothetical protein HMI55_000573 [Coelomomyces lativittatus]|nr:hypothetical protein HMI55_000573 [Coelomomyces lativittatus]